MKQHRQPQMQGLTYAQRLQVQKYQTIAEQRDDAAKMVLLLACVALNDTEGLGPVRIKRFADRLNELTAEFYADRETGVTHLNQRLTQMGFVDDEESLKKLVELYGPGAKK